MAAQDDVQAIKDRLSIVDVVGQYVQLRRAGRNFVARCPFHKERTPSFHVSPERGTYICFGCGEKGDIFSFMERMESADFKTVLRELAHKAGVELHRDFTPKAENKEKDARLYDALERAAQFYQGQLAAREDVHAYLKSRGVAAETKRLWRLGYAPAGWHALCEHLEKLGFSNAEAIDAGLAVQSEKKDERGGARVYDRFRGRVMFPISDASGRVIAFSGRFFEKVDGSREEGEPAKYVNSPETVLFKKSRVLYGFHVAKSAIRRADCILLVEGQFDLILAHQSGLPFCVALSGTALTPEHLSLLGRLSKRLVLALDGDAAGIRSGLKSALMAIHASFDVKVPAFPSGKDPADVARASPELLKAAVRTSKTAVEFFLDAVRPSARDERIYKRTVEAHILPLIGAMASTIEQEHFTRIVAQKLGVSEGAVRQEVAKRKGLPTQEFSETSDAVAPRESVPCDPLEKKVAMILFSFAPESSERSKLAALLGEEKVKEAQERLAAQAEEWRFRFEAELGPHTSETTIAADMLDDIARAVEKERVKMKYS